jgi:hypothetical protein
MDLPPNFAGTVKACCLGEVVLVIDFEFKGDKDISSVLWLGRQLEGRQLLLPQFCLQDGPLGKRVRQTFGVASAKDAVRAQLD